MIKTVIIYYEKTFQVLEIYYPGYVCERLYSQCPVVYHKSHLPWWKITCREMFYACVDISSLPANSSAETYWGNFNFN